MKRPLVISIICFIATSFISISLSQTFTKILLTLSVIAFVLFLVIAIIKRRHYASFMSLVLAFILAGVFTSYTIHIPNKNQAKEFDGYSGELSGQIISLNTSDNLMRMCIKTETVGDKKAHVKLLFYIPASDTSFKEGDYVNIIGDIHTAFTKTLTYDSETALASNGIFLLLRVKSIEKSDIPPNFFRNAVYNLRQSWLKDINELDNSGFVSALAIGDKSNLDPEIKEAFQKLGLSHALAVSGMHLSILIMTLFMLLKRKSISKYILCASCTFLVIFYMFLTGLSFSIIRSGIMMIIYFLSLTVRRLNDSITTLFVSALIIARCWVSATACRWR